MNTYSLNQPQINTHSNHSHHIPSSHHNKSSASPYHNKSTTSSHQPQHNINSHLQSSKTKSCLNIQSKTIANTTNLPKTQVNKQQLNQASKQHSSQSNNRQQSQWNNRQLSQNQKIIQNLLSKRNHSHQKILTDQTTYTYKPQITNLPIQLYPSTRSQIQISKQNILQRLLDNMKSKHQNLHILKLQKQQLSFQQNCTFKPQISSSTKAILNKLNTQSTPNQLPFERLYHQGLQKIKYNQKQYLTAKEKQLTEQHTFQPFINPTSKAIFNNQTRNLSPIYKRIDQIVQKKRQTQKNIQNQKIYQIQKMVNLKITNQKTLQILQNNPNYQKDKNNVVKRLLDNYFKEKQLKISNLMQQQKLKIKKQCTFQPKVNKNYLLMNASSFDPDQEFFDRQKDFDNAVKQNLQIKANQLVPTFKPQINKLSQLICKDRNYESLDDKLNRLNYEPLFEKQAQIEEIQKSLYKQCRFHPEINEISKALQGNSKPHACKCHPVPESFNFIPKINEKSRQMASNKVPEEMNKNRKEEMANKIKMEREYKQLIECTFQPKIKNLNKQHLKLNENTADFVPGVRQFVEKRNLMMKKKMENEKYKEKIFNLEKRYKSKTCTSVQQFKLSHNIYDGKGKKQLIQEAEQKFIKEHPFKPKIESIR